LLSQNDTKQSISGLSKNNYEKKDRVLITTLNLNL